MGLVERGTVGSLRRAAACALAVALVVAPALARAATVRLYPTTNSVAGTVAAPASAYADDGTPAQISPAATLTLDGFPATDLGTITGVTVSVDYSTSATPSNDTYQLDASTNGSTWTTIVAASTTPRASYLVASASLGALTWADVGTLQVRALITRVSGPDGYKLNLDAAWIDVTYTPPVAPGAPGTLSFSSVGTTSVRVGWTAATGAVTYKVERAPDAGGAPGGFTQVATGVAALFVDEASLSGNTSYWYRVRATNAAGDGPYSATASVLTLPAAPGAPTFTNVTTSGARVAWTAPAGGATSYRVERAPDSGGAPGTWSTVAASVASLTWDDSGLSAGTTYWYRVSAANGAGTGPSSAASSLTTTAAATPVVPGAVTGTADSCAQVTVRAAFTGDDDLDGSVAIARGNSATGPWTTVSGCAAVTGASPRTCVDGGATTGTLYYRATFTDPDAAPQPAAVVSAAIAVPVCGAAVTLADPGGQPVARSVAAGAASAAALRLRLTAAGDGAKLSGVSIANLGTAVAKGDVHGVQLWDDAGTPGALDAADTPLGNAAWDAVAGKYVVSGLALALANGVPENLLVTVSFAAGAVAGRTFDASVAVAGVVVTSPATVGGAPVSSGGTITVAAGTGWGSTDANAPMVSVLNPAGGTAVSGTFKLQAKIHDRAGLTGATVVASADGGTTWPYTLARSTRYAVGSNAAVYEAQLTLAPGAYTLRVRATNAAALSAVSAPIVLTVNASGRGGGTLLGRDNSSQLCVDCHALQSHDSQSTSGKYGSWAVGCRDCHTPHGTGNVYLVNEEITPPTVAGAPGGYQERRRVYFARTTGAAPGGGAASPSTASFANGDGTGPCQVCHTRTVRYTRTAAIDASHVGNCADCHKHTGGFKGGGSCATCHLGAGDVDSWAWNGTKAIVDQGEWTSYGHGRASAFASGNAAAGFDAQGAALQDRGCAYCHSELVPHADANYFRLANTDKGANGPCLVCHSSSYAGYDPDGAGTDYVAKNGKDVGKEHFGAKHGGSNQNGGQFCWDCHDPHGDASASSSVLWYMVQRRPVEQSDGANLPQSLAAAIEFRPAVGGDTAALDYADYSAGGLCRNCHDAAVAHYSKTTSDGHGLTATTATRRCTDCHKHQNGFQASCNTCHSGPPTSGKHGRHYEVATAPTAYGDGTSAATATQYGFGCGKCHAATHLNDANAGTLAQPHAVEVKYDATNPSPAAYAAGAAQTPVQGPGGEYFRWTNGSCTSTYCHSNANPVGGTNAYATVTWAQAGSLTCTSCHQGAGAATTLSPAHRIHTGTYAFGCERCHVATASGGTTISDKRRHVNGLRDVAFNATGVDNSGGGWNGGGRTCSNTYCHSSGQDRTAPYVSGPSIAWNSTRTCRSCHAGDATAAPTMASGSHGAHVNAASVIGTNFGCEKCHAATVSSSTVVSTPTNHVNGAANVQLAAGSYAGGSCTSTACHQSGGAGSGAQSYPATWGGAALDCKGCHGRFTPAAFTSVAGEPNYTNGGAATVSANSHSKHVSAASDCGKCHAGTTTTGTAIVLGSTLHLNAAKNVSFSGVGASPAWNSGTKTCSGISCHGAGAPVWGGAALKCGDCHLTTGTELNDWTYGNGAIATINSTEWTGRGHGQAAIALGGTNPCLYCHSASVNHGVGTNPFRLANVASAQNDNCLVCHKAGSAGYDPDGASTGYALKNSTKKIGAAHAGSKHGTTNDGGTRCWDCHDPHGDGSNIRMVGADVLKDAGDAYGLTGTRAATAVVFTANATGTDYAKSASPWNGVCNVCHATANHYKATSGDGHNSTKACVTCHAHDQGTTDAFKPAAGGDCKGCHFGTGSSTQGTRRDVGPDFSKQSHHVGNATTGYLRGTLTNNDCIVCHAEGTITGGAADTTSYHANGKIDLRNADNAATVYSYDKDAVKASAGAAAAAWNSTNAVWRTQTSTTLDPFCLSCHDSNGASGLAALWDAGASATNPFNDTANGAAGVSNTYDQKTRTGVVDVKSMVSGAPPAKGTFSRHAIRGQSTSVYSAYTGLAAPYKTMYDYGAFTAPVAGANEAGVPFWSDKSVMGCADCHTTDGANGTSGNAHGSGSEYLLKDASGTAAEGNYAGLSYVCYRCHKSSLYAEGSHTPNGGDWQDYTGAAGTARIPVGNTGGNFTGMACVNCHGGSGFGRIHGTEESFNVKFDGSIGTNRPAYRFMNGASMRFWNPNGWNTTGGTCYTLSSGDGWGGCTKHSGGTGYTRAMQRPVSY